MDYDQFTEQDWLLEFSHLKEPAKDLEYYKKLARKYKALAEYKESIINKLLDKIVILESINTQGGYQAIKSNANIKPPQRNLKVLT